MGRRFRMVTRYGFWKTAAPGRYRMQQKVHALRTRWRECSNRSCNCTVSMIRHFSFSAGEMYNKGPERPHVPHQLTRSTRKIHIFSNTHLEMKCYYVKYTTAVIRDLTQCNKLKRNMTCTLVTYQPLLRSYLSQMQRSLSLTVLSTTL